MPKKNHNLVHALGTRSADIVLPKHVQHRGTGYPGHYGYVVEPQDSGGPDQLLNVGQRVLPERLKPYAGQPIEDPHQNKYR